MNFKQTWSASSADTVADEDRDLSQLVGIWSSQIEVSISNPARINYGFADIREIVNDDALCPMPGTADD